VRLNVPVKKEQCFVKRLYLRPVNAILHWTVFSALIIVLD
jgi:hypothetical protein